MKNIQTGIRTLLIVSVMTFGIECTEKNVSGPVQTPEPVQHTKSQQETMPVIDEQGTQNTGIPLPIPIYKRLNLPLTVVKVHTA